MFCSVTANNRISKCYKRALRLVNDDHETSLSDSLAIDGSFTVHHTNIQTLLLEIYKIKRNFSKSCLKDLFGAVNRNYNIRS